MTDPQLFASLPGGEAIVGWFGCIPSFHDATLERLEIGGDEASLTLRAFRMTSVVDAEGHFVLDRHALVTIQLRGVTGLRLEGQAGAIVAGLVVRRVETTPEPGHWTTCAGPSVGDLEATFDTSFGLFGSLFAKEVSFDLQPLDTLGQT